MKYAKVVDNLVQECVDDAAYETFNDTVKAMFQEVPSYVERRWKLIDNEWVEPDPKPEPEPVPKQLTKLQFIRHIQEHGGTTKSNVTSAYKDPELEYFWVIFEVATEIEKDDPDTQESLEVFETQGYLPNGVQPVLDNWPTV